MDVYAVERREKEYFRRLEQQIHNMLLDKTVDYRQLCKELDHSLGWNRHSNPEKLEVVRILCDIRKTGLYDKKKLQKVINHYATEYDNMLILKP